MAGTVGTGHSFRGRDSNQCSSSSSGRQEDPIITHGAVRELVEADNSRLSPQIIIIVRQQHKQQKQKQLGLRA